MNIFPKTRDFKASVNYKMVNKTAIAIDSLFVDHNSYPSTFEFDKEMALVSEDTIYHFDIYKLESPLQPGDTLELKFSVKNKHQ